ncbi:hypothetical protein J1N10_20420 [Carboxylicivirga sp. A043]|uniref:hypothetical protein n=1 Tax=Carboxylicivirga litoralis TaxID=2816963 RepID=UPI0021CB36CD|nr:hypothetical protein [Carboxylicivirga sp. A043]MCU4158350.1 hypothetical protein [Carboxylicivirga sp. A043]
MNNNLEKRYADKVSNMSDLEIVNNFNWEALGKGWTSSRAIYLSCLRSEIIKRWGELDWFKDNTMTMKYPIVLVQNKLIQMNPSGLKKELSQLAIEF